ncbi:AraC family transcriptional regulator [Paenibacillus cellulositrophicus]|uniref:AraC family transcriptional regulator n=1 Tax=Paenibacillus cellulositrophicus TaxID=562959 RepID=UPI00203DCD7E|nr:AraC family transcriptional regulator [Paenibacillus cellulositrophicus]MCM2996893.1 AraC family transcriptional regulator [Paenibacillus cellulositrophicus]
MKIHNAIPWQDNLYLFHFRSVHTSPIEYFHAHEGLEILFVHEGVGRYVINNELYPLKPSTLILVKPFQMHEIKVQVPPSYTRTLLKIKSSVMERFMTVLPQLASVFALFLEHRQPSQVFYLAPADASYLEEQFRQLSHTLAIVPPHLRMDAVTLFSFQFFEYFVSRIYVPDSTLETQMLGHAGQAEIIGRIVKWIDRHLNQSFTLNELAAELHFSPNYLSKTFKEQMGVSITAYANEQRLEKAKILLADPSLTVENVSRRAGFKYPSYFISLFKAKYGLTPRRYRMSMEK